MKNKVLVSVVVPLLNNEFECFIPVNERISKIKELLIKVINEISDGQLNINRIYSLLDPDNGTIYDSRVIVRDTNISNTKRLIIV